ncbi:MAG: sulfite exporter TauE/SafE family protein [Haliscomenobacter sp.]|nr:sulfite exporter TauE/SafE family protein [Haliscomenobacter sp.]MBK7476557.1 sulfite exporter TauE/SafE family protein [Haliscomenobacter sp.]MBK8879508.1 sulfite exporter TauE/SafE family protein [Haliscomenobacter sp.]
MDWLNQLAQNGEFPILAAFALGLLTAVSPCPLATNITATAYISRQLKSKREVLLSGLLYTLGRAISYTGIGLALYWGASKFHVARFFQSKGELFLAPILILVGLVMLGVIRLDFLGKGSFTEGFTERFKDRGLLGALVMGILFALAFCPYSGVLYFGMLIPMTVSSPSGLYLPFIFALGTGLPVLLFAYLLAYSASKVGKAYNMIQKTEKVMRYVAGGTFLLAGLYYAYIFIQ